MTMAEVLESIQGLGIRFDRHAARLKALEEETGMDSDPDDEDDEAKKAEEAMADDDDPDKDRGRSTRTPGVQAMGRAESRRAAKEKDKLARSGRYENIGVNPTQLEQTGSKDVTEGHAKGQKAEGAGRADTRTGRSQEGGTPSIRPEEGTDPGSEGAAKPHCPGEAQRGQIPRNSDGNPNSPQVVVFLATIVDVTVGS